jgi:dTDP-4-dehydrorhamnose 3,5-epimerase
MSALFDILDTPLQGLELIQRKPIGDSRGYLERLFCQTDLAEVLNGKSVVQINHTLTEKIGTVRGMHFQYPPHAETKFVMCLKGEVFDVAVDVRVGSSTFLHWHAEILNAANYKTFVIPEGFAHGFQSLTADCEMLYFHTTAYQLGAEGGLNALDSRLAIKWPLKIAEQSERDRAHLMIAANFHGVLL